MAEANNHSPHLAHHFSEMEQQRDSAKLGMWIFLITEILLFGGLFTAYTIYRSWHPDMFYNAHKFLDIYLGTTNTVVLITSSLTMALAIRSMQIGLKKRTIIFLTITLILAAVFLVIKFFEYHHKFELGQLPGKYYTFTGIEGTNPHIFFSMYFMMTGLHGIHVIAGICVIGWLLRQTIKNRFSPEYYTPLEMTGLYWHLVDIIWIFLFPLFYLVG
ncbi:Cytochrome c oxidase subunit III [Candidatus Zixiibacteriota bacterium]|nr:Cytochrome c oxidase subunit III [candidate division Zixibacteria bacterium]